MEQCILEAIKVLIKSYEYLEGSVVNGTLRIIVNYGLVYIMDMKDQIPTNMSFSIVGKEITTEVSETKYIEVAHDPHIIWLINEKLCNLPIGHPETCKLSCWYERFDLDPLFDNMRTGKVTDGSYTFKLDDMTGENKSYIFILYKGMFNLTKGDTVSVNVYDLPYTENQIFVDFIINRVKFKRSFHLYFNAINLWKG